MDLVIVILIMASMCSTDGKKSAKLPRRLDVLEYKMTSLELRVIGDASKINDLSDMVEYMNLTFHDHEAVCRNTVASRTTKPQASNTDSVKNIEDIGDRVMAAFQEEKIKLRETVNKVNNTLVELRETSSMKAGIDLESVIDDYNELKNTIENINVSLIEKQDELTRALETLASELKQDRLFNKQNLELERQKQDELTSTVKALAIELKQDRMLNKRKSETERKDVINDYNELKNAMKNTNISLVGKQKELTNTLETLATELKQGIMLNKQTSENERKAAKDYYNELKNTVKNINSSLTGKQEELTSKVEALATEVKQTVSEVLKYFVTEQIKGTTNTSDISDRKVACPNLWNRYELFCYRYFNRKVIYTEAQRRCADSGAYVVDIHNQAELDFVMSLTGRRTYWIGLTDVEEEGTWKWDRTKSEASFTNWGPGQPDGNLWWLNQDCATAYAGQKRPLDQWNNIECGSIYHYICKKSL